jgi:hypothetical protein
MLVHTRTAQHLERHSPCGTVLRGEKKKSSALEGESVRATQTEHTGSSHHKRVRAHHTNTHTQYMLPRGS